MPWRFSATVQVEEQDGLADVDMRSNSNNTQGNRNDGMA